MIYFLITILIFSILSFVAGFISGVGSSEARQSRRESKLNIKPREGGKPRVLSVKGSGPFQGASDKAGAASNAATNSARPKAQDDLCQGQRQKSDWVGLSQFFRGKKPKEKNVISLAERRKKERNSND